ncbi:uncharacterized protein F4812DRAFT_373457 [Daldinia caldariorum]|uniref:uncharacterized protein n=1 Tax=Daldinia caldariorum TaxID=326644 RepID=UPI002008E65C|nr:uncharacterized protein F4812DRAFT_373457 [Daldinia caldariorum]KAI1468559.1 hypothetical protein F4812DRAFT_373457 [Daldinia caldariorum]
MLATSRILSFAALWRASAALLVADGSPCGTKCGNVLSSTTSDMIVCDDSAYSLSSPGQVYQACIGCESTSSYTTPNGAQNKSDLQYMLYNMRYAVNVCLFEAATNPCITSFACGNIQSAIQYGNLTSSSSIYDYCDKWTDYNLDKCHACLTSSSNSNYLNNYISILDGACRLRLEPPATLPLQGNIFSTDVVNVTEPTPTATFAPPGLKGPLDAGAIAGIVVGGIVVLLVILGCGVVLNGKRRRKAYLRRREQTAKNWPSTHGGGEMYETPVSQKPLRGWEDSPISAATQTTFPPYFSPYSSQYNSPVSAFEGPSNMAWPVEKSHNNIGIAISPDREAYSPWSDRKGKEKASPVGDGGYELQEGLNSAGGYENSHPIQPAHAYNPPILGHPGYGRRSTGSQESPQE